jgi:hypothetical protein
VEKTESSVDIENEKWERKWNLSSTVKYNIDKRQEALNFSVIFWIVSQPHYVKKIMKDGPDVMEIKGSTFNLFCVNLLS